MTAPNPPSRRALFVKAALIFNGIAGAILAVPILRYILSPITHLWEKGYESWLPLGELAEFPQNQTRLATYRNPVVNPWDGQTADIPCWVRNLDGRNFQVFAINCAHLGCPVRWFPQSNLFLCPFHGGAYYADGSHAAGPPPRGLFPYRHRIVNGKLFIKAGEIPTTGSPTAKTTGERPECA
jgi:menaquinol-cytochrome c reductase iron-sulfur subunit